MTVSTPTSSLGVHIQAVHSSHRLTMVHVCIGLQHLPDRQRARLPAFYQHYRQLA